jgi:hypothetical protein
MSKRETLMTLWYWEQLGGTLIEEFPVVRRSHGTGARLLDAVILPDRPRERLTPRTWLDLSKSRVVVVQTKNSRLGMYLMGQTLFSKRLIETHFTPREVLAVALCKDTDAVLEPLLLEHPGCQVVVAPIEMSAAVRVASPRQGVSRRRGISSAA